jgi:hypothetical protein
MESRAYIQSFLENIRKKQVRNQFLASFYGLFTFMLGLVLLASLSAYFFPEVQEVRGPLSALAGLSLLIVVSKLFWLNKRLHLTLDQAALLTEEKVPDLNNSLINSLQLSRYLDQPETASSFSPPLIKEHLQRTQPRIKDIDSKFVLDTSSRRQNRNVLLVSVAVSILVILALPDLFSRSYSNWMQTPGLTMASNADNKSSDASRKIIAKTFSIDKLALTYHYPAYTKLESLVVDPSNGKIEVLPGTEVQIIARTNHPVAGAELMVNGNDSFQMKPSKAGSLNTRFLVKEKGYYQFRIKSEGGTKLLLEEKYPIALSKDMAPSIILFLANPKPVYYENDKIQIFYEAHDDFGINAIELVSIANGSESRFSVKKLKGRNRDDTGSYSWNLIEAQFKPGDEVQYYLEIQDNDNVNGPNTGQSEMFSFTVFDSRKERDNLIALQEQLTEKMIAQLGYSLVEGYAITTTSGDIMRWKNVMTTSADNLIDIISMAQRILEQSKSLENFPRPYQHFLNNLITGMTRVRDEQIEAINQLNRSAHKTTPVSYSSDGLESINDRVVRQLETSILFLVRMTNRQKMDQVMDLERQLNELTQNLREEFDNIKNKKSPLQPEKLKAKLEQIRQILQKIMDQLSTQTQSMPDEFLNSEAFESLNMEEFSDSLDRIMDLLDQGKFDQAMKEMEKTSRDLQTLSNQLNKSMDSMENMVDMEMMEMLDDSIAKLEHLERRQKDLLDKTTKINKALRSAQSEKFSEQVENLFDALKKDVNEIQGIFTRDQKLLTEHPIMQKLTQYLDEEEEIRKQIREIGQQTVDSAQGPGLQENFENLNKARRSLSRVIREISNLRVRVYRKFKEELINLSKSYDILEELAEAYDLDEFNSVFKNTYPEVFHWQNNLRTTRNKQETIGNKLDSDLREVSRLNGEISKKLGSMMQMIRDSEQSLLTEENISQLNKLAEQENQLLQETDKMQQRFDKMNQQNPMISPELSAKMARTKQHMKRAESNLKAPNIKRSISSENNALTELQETRDMINEFKNSNSQNSKQSKSSSPMKLGSGSARDGRRGGTSRMKKEQVHLPSEDHYKVPREFREDILKAMKKHTPKSYERLVNEYYKELVN